MIQEVIAFPPGTGLAQSNPEKAIELLQAQIAGVKQEISDLTVQLVPGSSDARENAIDQQLSSATERLGSLQSQLDRVVSGDQLFNYEGSPPSPPDGNDIPRGVQSMLESLMLTAVVIVLGFPLARMLARRLEPKTKVDPAGDQSRFERLEQAVDAVAIEIERISEGQRYSNKMMSELRALPAPNPLEQWPLGTRQKVEERVPGGA